MSATDPSATPSVASPQIPKSHERLSGQHECTLDEKGRLSIPAEFRTILELLEGAELKVSRHINLPCVVVYRPDAFNALLDQAERSGSKEGKALIRVVGGTARTMVLDKAGRISVPGLLRDHAGLSGSTFVTGQDQHLEIWDPERWHAHYGIAKFEAMDFSDWM
jgi:MraZ protein